MSSTASTAIVAPAVAPWHLSYPAPSATVKDMTIKELHDLLRSTTTIEGSHGDFLVIDVRRTDIEGDMSVMIPGAINLPAQTFYPTLPALISILSTYKQVIFHCSSSNGRGPRCAGWYQDELNKRGETRSEAKVLKGGIKSWMAEYGGEVVRI